MNDFFFFFLISLLLFQFNEIQCKLNVLKTKMESEFQLCFLFKL